MDFEEWWDKEREESAKQYVMLGAFALRNIAWCAWNAGQDAVRGINTVKDDKLNTFCPNCGCGVAVDEDGCCRHCGATAIGEGVDQLFNVEMKKWKINGMSIFTEYAKRCL